MAFGRERQVAIDAVLKACALCSEVQHRVVEAGGLIKDDLSPVTVADFGSQAIISHLLAVAFPDVPLTGEEDAQALNENAATRSEVVRAVQRHLPLEEAEILAAIDRGSYTGGASGSYWTLDPVDGTKGFLRKDQYAVCLAHIVDGSVVLGVLGCPSLPPGGCLQVAVRGQGAWQRSLTDSAEVRISVSDVTDASLGKVVEPVERGSASHEKAAEVVRLLGTETCHMDSQCKYATVARGDFSIYLRLPAGTKSENIWDHAAGYCITMEAGGRVTDVDGEDLDFSRGRSLTANRGIVVTNGRLHEQVMEAVSKVCGPAKRSRH